MQNFFQSELLENLTLRSNYRKERHRLWSNQIDDEGKIKKVNLIKNKLLALESNSSRKFYRYKSFHDWDEKRLKSEINNIINKTLTFVTPSLFNDPYDCRPPTRLMQKFLEKRMSSDLVQKYKTEKEAKAVIKEIYPNSKNIKKLTKQFLAKQAKEIKNPQYSVDRINGIRKGIPIICFSNKPNDMYFWSHYGGVHSGFCIEYEFSNELFDKFLHPVEYVKKWPSDFDKITTGANVALSLIKSIDWAQELEWRMAIQYNENCDKEVVTIPNPAGLRISAIYLGLDFFKSNNPNIQKKREKLLESFSEKNIFQIELGEDNFQIEYRTFIREI